MTFPVCENVFHIFRELQWAKFPWGSAVADGSGDGGGGGTGVSWYYDNDNGNRLLADYSLTLGHWFGSIAQHTIVGFWQKYQQQLQ